MYVSMKNYGGRCHNLKNGKEASETEENLECVREGKQNKGYW